MTAAIIQARMGSTRLPGKVLQKLNDRTLLECIIWRIKECKNVNQVVVATTDNEIDDAIELWCKQNNIVCFRGDENNVLKRYYDAATFVNADVIVRVTADDPFKDPIVIDAVIDLLNDKNLDFAFNNCPTSFPEGLDTEVFTYEAISRAVNSDTTDFEKEHVTQYFYHNPDEFKMENYSYDKDVSNIRLTVDSEEDYELACKLYGKLSPNGEMFYLEDILSLLDREPKLLEINKSVKRSAMYE